MDTNIIFGKVLDKLRKEKGWTMEELGSKLGKTKSAVSRWISGENYPKVDDIEKITQLFDIDIETLIFGKKDKDIYNKIYKNIKSLNDINLNKILNYSKSLVEEQKNFLKEDISYYKVIVTEQLSAGTGYAYGDNETEIYYTDRDNLKHYDLASYVRGDSMLPIYKNGDVVLIKSGYDSTNGAVYAIDYNGESFLKRVFFEGNRIRLVSYNHDYEDIYINLPVDEDVYLNIIGKVIDSFTPIEN